MPTVLHFFSTQVNNYPCTIYWHAILKLNTTENKQKTTTTKQQTTQHNKQQTTKAFILFLRTNCT